MYAMYFSCRFSLLFYVDRRASSDAAYTMARDLITGGVRARWDCLHKHCLRVCFTLFVAPSWPARFRHCKFKPSCLESTTTAIFAGFQSYILSFGTCLCQCGCVLSLSWRSRRSPPPLPTTTTVGSSVNEGRLVLHCFPRGKDESDKLSYTKCKSKE